MAKIHLEDTIAAVSTPPGESGIAVIRLSGSGALKIADRFFKPRAGRSLCEAEPQRVFYGTLLGPDGGARDGVLAVTFRAPHSYTGEDTVEISCHGGLRVTRCILEIFLSGGARLAEPGEFTRRAFLNGRLDLVQAEAVLDIIKAKTDASLRQAERQLEGELSRSLKDIRRALLEFHAEIEASIDFPEEDKEVYESRDLKETLSALEGRIRDLLRTAGRGRMLRDGVILAIVGKPNTGKSSLLNALLKRERAIVTPVPGTTRDTIEEWIEIGGYPVKLIDTAGITRTKDLVERIGIQRTRSALREAQLILCLFDGSRPFTGEDERILKSIPKERPVIVLLTKKDLRQRIRLPEEAAAKARGVVKLSSRTGAGLNGLEREIVRFLESGREAGESVLVTNLRHLGQLERALKFLARAGRGLAGEKPLEIIAEDVKGAVQAVGEITGEIYTEDLLDAIFSRFCIGK